MAKKTIYGFVKHCINDMVFNAGGIPSNEKKWLDSLGLDYKVDEDGFITESGEDLAKFYEAMQIIRNLNEKYSKEH